MNSGINFSKGSEWRKWDLHIHTPSSIEQNYGGEAKWDEFILALEQLPPEVKVIGINDYYFIDGYERVMQYKKKGRLANIEKIFSVLEFRIDTFGSGNENNLQKINLHIIFNINEADFENEVKKIKKEFIELIPITKLPKHQTKCLSHENFVAEGNGKLQDGFSSLIPSTDKVFELLNNPTWENKSFLLLGYKEWSNLEKNNQLKLLKEDLYNRVNAFFTSNYDSFAKSRQWLSEYGEKALIHSRDIHGFDVLDTLKKEGDRQYLCNTWIKADPTFEGLKQIIYEPQNRVFIGTESPDLHRENCIRSIAVEKKWFPQKELPLNSGLVSIIGARGSGKTALLDLIALGAGVYCENKANFLYKAKKEVQPLVSVINLDGKVFSETFNPDNAFSEPLVQYLSQQFVENLCSENGSTGRLQSEIERFIFENIDVVERMGTSNFSELKDVLCKTHRETTSYCRNKISDLNIKVSEIHHLQTVDLPNKKKEKVKLENELNALKAKLPILNETSQNESMKEREKINLQKLGLENELKQEWAQIGILERINSDIGLFGKTIAEKNDYFKNELLKQGIDDKLLLGLNISYYGSLINELSKTIDLRKKEFYKRYGNKESPDEDTYRFFVKKLNDIRQKTDQYTEDEKYYLDTSNKIELKNTEIKEITEQISNINSLDIKKLQEERFDLYIKIFEEISKEKEILESLYKPLVEQLKRNKQEEQLGFFVKINIDLESWVKQGEKLIDFRKIRELHESKSLFELAHDKLYEAWINCDLNCITKVINDFFNEEARKMGRMLLNSSSMTELADWLFSTNHISISYEMTFNKTPLNFLSPGTKGVLLMLLYLGVDKNDARPLLIDQPEDNLDPESVHSILVPYFMEAKRRRQIIMVTHNPNLVVATDSDQVIVANIESNGIDKLPTFTYFGGGLENQEIVTKVCSILEGGMDAFKKREERYFDQYGSK